jgi:uncharacterized membrane protein
MTVLAIIGLVLLVALLLAAAGAWFSEGGFFGWYFGGRLLEDAIGLMGIIAQLIASMFSNSDS